MLSNAELAAAYAKGHELDETDNFHFQHMKALRAVEDAAVAAYRAEIVKKAEANGCHTTEAEGEAFASGYFCALDELEK